MSNKNIILATIAALIIISTGVWYFIFQQKPASETLPDENIARLEELKQAISRPPVIGETYLSPEEQENKLRQFNEVLAKIEAVGFDTLQGINEIAQRKRELGDFDGAIAAWEYAGLIRPGNSLSFSNLAALYHYDLKDFIKAEENYKISVANDPDDLPTIRNFYELYFYDLKDNTQAEGLLLRSIEANLESADIYSLTARFYADTQRPEKAIEFLEKHLELAPGNDAARREIQRLQALIH